MIINKVDSFLNSITLYRLILYGLSLLAGVAVIYSVFGLLPFTPLQLLVMLSVVFLIGFVTKFLLQIIFKPITNFESTPITLLILFFILAPLTSQQDVWITVLATVFALSSKFLLAIDKKHIFNPAASGVFLIGLLGFGNAIWWVGSSSLLPWVVLVGLLIVRKLRKFYLLWTFLVTAVLTIIFFNLKNGVGADQSFIQAFLSWPLFFFATVMLTEPLTSPQRKYNSVIYGVIVGILFGSQFHIGPLYASPELSLLIGNLFAFIVSPKYKLFLQLQKKVQISPMIYELVFRKMGQLSFLPGQYMEWTIPDALPDSRGNRRYFTISSSPTEDDLKITIKTEGIISSSFKKKLLSMDDGTVVASQLSGDFILPEDTKEKLVFIAGGIGITPFRSMIKYLLDKKEKREILLFYACSSEHEFVYKELFSRAEQTLGIKTIYIITNKKDAPRTWKGEVGYLTQEMVEQYVPSIKEYHYFLSGPNRMVESYRGLLHSIGVKDKNITTDYFPGF